MIDRHGNAIAVPPDPRAGERSNADGSRLLPGDHRAVPDTVSDMADVDRTVATGRSAPRWPSGGVTARALAGVLVAVSTAVAAGLLGSCSVQRPHLFIPAVAPDDGHRVKGSVVLTGDSLTVGVSLTLPELARARGIDLHMGGEAGRRIADGVAELPLMLAHRDLVIVALGTNDTSDGLDAEQLDARIDSLLAVTGPDIPVIWVSVYRRDSEGAGAAAERFNDALRRATDRHANLSVADWWSYITLHQAMVGIDGIHLTTEGYAARTAWLLRQMAARLPPT